MKKYYEHIIIGGGIVGAGIFRDLSLHGEEVLLIDKGDFCSQTSQASSKMLHGGIRYLENFDFMLVREALKEKYIWTKLASHITKEEMFLLPVYKNSKWPIFFIRIGLFIYDLLSFFKNPRFKILNKKKTLELMPDLNPEGLKGSGLYSDAIVEDAKLGLECIYDGISDLAQAKNYHSLEKVFSSNEFYELLIRDEIEKKVYRVTCKNLIFATGPFTDQVLNRLNISWKNIMTLSKGSHLWISKESLNVSTPMVLQTKDQRIIFVIPQRDAILIGTTEITLDENEKIFNIKVSEDEISYILEAVNEYFPNAKIDKSSIIGSFAGVRPLIKNGNTANSKLSRKHKIYTPQKNVYVIAGGKYTTFRIMAQDVCKLIFKNDHKRYIKNLSLKPFRKKSLVSWGLKEEVSEELIEEIINTELVRTPEDILSRRLSMIDMSKNSKLLKFIHHKLKSIK